MKETPSRLVFVHALLNLLECLETDQSLVPCRAQGDVPGFGLEIHLAFQLEAPAGVAFQPLLDNGGNGLVPDQHLAVSVAALVAVADGRKMHPVAVHHARACGWPRR